MSIVRTENEGEAKGLMGVMGNTDSVIVAGGDGTFSEVNLIKVLCCIVHRNDRIGSLYLISIRISPYPTNEGSFKKDLKMTEVYLT